MYRIFQLTKATADGKESQSIYSYDSYPEAKGDYETKLGQFMDSDAFSSYAFFLLDNVGDIRDSSVFLAPVLNGDGLEVSREEFRSRLFDVTQNADGTESANIASYETAEKVEASFHKKYGAAIKNKSVSAIMLRGIDKNANPTVYTYWVRPVEAVEEVTE